MKPQGPSHTTRVVQTASRHLFLHVQTGMVGAPQSSVSVLVCVWECAHITGTAAESRLVMGEGDWQCWGGGVHSRALSSECAIGNAFGCAWVDWESPDVGWHSPGCSNVRRRSRVEGGTRRCDWSLDTQTGDLGCCCQCSGPDVGTFELVRAAVVQGKRERKRSDRWNRSDLKVAVRCAILRAAHVTCGKLSFLVGS